MSYNTEKIIVKNDDNGNKEEVKLFYSTITDNVGITCGEQNVFFYRRRIQGFGLPYEEMFLYKRHVG